SHALAAVCQRWALRHRFTKPYRPQTNGKAERFIHTLLREWAYRVPYLRVYNHRRPHASLGRRSPWMRFQEAA
ncbi:MAG: integrase core domain-containing protein, partial [Acidimicrobiia bacterium]